MALEVERIEYGDHLTGHDYYQPVYRVDFWRQFEPQQPGDDPALMGWEKESFRLRGAKSAREARGWAEANGDGRDFVLWIELPPDDDRTIARVEGIDPTNPSNDSLAE